MLKMKKSTKFFLHILIIVSLSIFAAGCEKKGEAKNSEIISNGTASTEMELKAAPEPDQTESLYPKAEEAEAEIIVAANTNQAATQPTNVSPESKPAETSKPSGASGTMKELLDDVFYWKLLAKDRYGKKAPGFTLTDINGKEHKLSDYLGKKVIVLSWTVWCPGSKSQVAFLNEIREQISEDKLAILAVCHKTDRETIEDLKEFVAKKKLKITVFYEGLDALPTPFDSNLYVPCSYFIDSAGNFRLIAEEIITIKYLKKVLELIR